MSTQSPYGAREAVIAAETISIRIGTEIPVAGIILGSGLGGLAAKIRDAVSVPFADVPGFPSATVVGHAGRLIAGTLGGKRVIALAGRFHMYEGHDAALAGFPVRVLHALGARTLFVSNAAGGVNATFAPGDLMLIRDHINLMFRNPLIGALESSDERFPDMSRPYDDTLAQILIGQAASLRFSLREGVYCGLLGPTYETLAEVRMLATLGADAVGMSTVPEVIVARALAMRVAGVSCITNHAAGISPQPLSHAEVLETTALVATRFESLVEGFIRAL
ncbi:MAG TPA: purine-nucleoside phosphorylase [Gemmatimonadaceae bacterium]|nr:purine-nucleoside phosphorylase [Gemmatimonadaceae bacterium]